MELAQNVQSDISFQIMEVVYQLVETVIHMIKEQELVQVVIQHLYYKTDNVIFNLLQHLKLIQIVKHILEMFVLNVILDISYPMEYVQLETCFVELQITLETVYLAIQVMLFKDQLVLFHQLAIIILIVLIFQMEFVFDVHKDIT
jgi:hypothetical protein